MWLRVLGVVFLIVILAGGVGVYLATYTAPLPPPASAPEPVRIAALERLQNAVKNPTPAEPPATATPDKAAKGASKTPSDGDNRPVTVHFAQNDVNTMLQSDKNVQQRLRAAGIQAATVAFEQPNLVTVSAWMQIQGRQRQVTIQGDLAPDGTGGVAFHTERTQVGLLPLPAGISSQQIDDRASRLLQQAVPSLPIDVQSVAVRNGELTIGGTRKHKASKR